MSQLERQKMPDEAVFKELVEAATAAIFIIAGNKVRYANPAAVQLSGYGYDELLGTLPSRLFPLESRRQIKRIQQALQKGSRTRQNAELGIIRKNGEACWVNLTTTKINLGGKQAWVLTAFEITGRKRTEQLQDAVYRIAQAADQSKNLDDLFPAIHGIIGEVMKANNFYIALFDKETDRIHFPYYFDEYDPPAEAHAPGRGLTEWILRNGKSLLVDLDIQNAMEKNGEVELVGTPSVIWLGVPLFIEKEIIGAMVVQDYADASAYSEREQRMLEFVSSQVAMAIQRKRAEEALKESEERFRRRAEELSNLYETTRELTTQYDLHALMNTIADRVVTLLNSPGCSIYLYDAERRDLETVVARGWPGLEGIRLQMGEGVAGRVAQSLEPMVVEDHRTWEKRSEKFSGVPATAVCDVPMIYRGELIGVLTVFELDTGENLPIRKFTQADVDLMIIFAATTAGAVHNARLFSETRQRLVEIELLYQASLASSQIHSLKAVAQRIVDALDNLMDWKGSFWVLKNNHQPVLLAYGSKGLSREAHEHEMERIRGLIRSLDDGIIGWVFRNGVALRTGDVRTNPYYVLSDSRSVSEMCVPLKSGGKTTGCINVESEEKNAFSEHDERLLTTLANQAAAAIENAHLFEETRLRAGRQSALNKIIISATRAGIDLDSLLNTSLDQILSTFDLDMGGIWIKTTERGIQRVAAKGVPASLSFFMTNPPTGGSSSLRTTLVMDDIEKSGHPFSSTLTQLGIHGAIVCPLAVEEKTIGGLAVLSPKPRDWTTEEISFTETIARELGATADRVRLFDETNNRLMELDAVNRVSTTLRLSQSIETALPELLTETLKTLDTETGEIWLHDKDTGRLRQAVGRGWCSRLSQIELNTGSGIPGTVFASGDILFSHDIAVDPLTPSHIREIIPQGWSAVSTPIRTEHETIGVMDVFTQLPREFDAENARLLSTLTDMAGTAIHRMKLNESVRRHADELEERVALRTIELSEALKKSQEADRIKTEFIANINHELRTPLTNLILYNQMLLSQPSIKTQERLEVMGRELNRLRTLIEGLLNLSRLDLQQFHYNPVLKNLNEIIQVLVDDRRTLAEEHHLRLSLKLQKNIPSTQMDEALVVQAISNLLTNALSYTPAGGEVTIRSMEEEKDGNQWVGFSVEDTGPGIAPEDRAHLFDRFFRGKAGQNSGAPGTGLGLAIVKQVVDMHRGKIEVPESKRGGAIFRIWLPVKKQEAN